MLQSLIAAIVIFITSLFGGHQFQPPSAQSQPAAAAIALSDTPFDSPAATSSQNAGAPDQQATTTIVNTYVTQPVIERVVDSGSLASANFVTQDELNAQLQQLSDVLAAKFSASATPPVPQYVAAGGNSAFPYAAENSINQLSNVTITGATITNSSVNGGSGATSASTTLLTDDNTWLGGNLFLASTTIGNGTQADGLTISGGATTTGNAYFGGNIGIATTSTLAMFTGDIKNALDGELLYEDGSSIPSSGLIAGSPSLLTLETAGDETYYSLSETDDLNGSVGSYVGDGHALGFDSLDLSSNETGSNYLLGNGGFAFNDWVLGTNTLGIYSPSLGVIGIGALNAWNDLTPSGPPVAVFDTVSNNVGIGTTTPTTTLAVAGTGQFTGQVAIGNDAQVSLTDSNPALTSSYQSGLRLHNDFSGDLSWDTSNIIYNGIDNFSTYTHTGSGGLVSYGINSQPTITASSTGTVYFLSGLNADPTNYGSGDYTGNLNPLAFGIEGIAAYPTNHGSGEGDLAGIETGITSDNGLIDHAAGLSVDPPNFNGGATTNNYGLYINDQASSGSVQPTNNYQFFSNANGGNSPFVQLESGNVGIGATTSLTAGLTINGTYPNDGLAITSSANTGQSGSLAIEDSPNDYINGDNVGDFDISASQQLNFSADLGETDQMSITDAGDVGIGTTTPYSRLEVWGPDSAASTTAFAVVNAASTTEFTVRDNGNATLAGSLIQNSDQRLKTNVQTLNSSSSLAEIDALNAVTFNWIDPNKGTAPQLGFIAQQVLPIFPNLVSTTTPTALTPNGTLSVNYIGLIAPIISAIQALDQQLNDLENTVAGFAQSFTTNQLTFNRASGSEITSNEVNTQELCVGSTCVTPAQFQAMVAAAGQSSGPASSPNGSTSTADATDTPPVIQVNGDNPATVQVGDTYNDLGATITGPQDDLNLGITTYVNGVELNPVQIDTTEAATDTIDYVATDQSGLSATSTRTVIIESAAPPSIVPTDAASTTDATSTAQ